jgi:predicted nucleic acid-binding protein
VAGIVLYDACVLYSAPLHDLLMQLAITGLFQARWTDQIHEEWIRNVLANRHDVSQSSLLRCRKLMDEHVPDCLVTGYEALIPSLILPDQDDRHVLAAAIHGRAELILTYNLGDFPASTLEQFHIEAVHPDEFVVGLCDEHLDTVIHAMKLHRASLRKPPNSASEYLSTLERCQLSQTAACTRAHTHRI